MKKSGNDMSNPDHAAISSNDVQLLIENRIAYLIDKEKEESQRNNPETKEKDMKKDVEGDKTNLSAKNMIVKRAKNILANISGISKKLPWHKRKT